MNLVLTSAIAAVLMAQPHGSAPSVSRDARVVAALDLRAEARIRRVGTLRFALSAHAATAIARNRVLITGGMRNGGTAVRSYELFDASTHRSVAVGEMAEARAGHGATLLPDGRVLVTGGYNGSYLATAEIFDPQTARFSATGSMSEGRSGHTTTLLTDGTVLVTGGVGDGWSFLSSAEVYDPATGTFSRAGSLRVPRESQTATLMRDGRVLIAGGHRGRRANIVVYASTEIYDPARRVFRAGPSMNVARHKHEAVSFADGRVMVLGGSDPRDRTRYASTEILDPRTGAFAVARSMGLARHKVRDTAVRLTDGRILVAGGARSAELFDARTGTFRRVAGDFGQEYAFATATLLASGDVLVIGGYDDGMRTTAGVWRFHE